MPTTTLEFSSGRRGLEIRNKGRENWRVREEVLRHVFFSRRVTHATAQKVRGEKREKVRFPFLEKSILYPLVSFFLLRQTTDGLHKKIRMSEGLKKKKKLLRLSFT